MIRNAVIHVMNEQPLLADLFEAPTPGDQGLRCTNLRTLNGTRPVFVAAIDSVFFFPYLHIRFVEIPPGAIAGSDASLGMEMAERGRTPPDAPPPEPELEPELEIDEDFLRRIREV